MSDTSGFLSTKVIAECLNEVNAVDGKRAARDEICLMKQTLRSRVANVMVLASWNVTLCKCWRFLAMWNLLQIGLPWNSHIFDINVRWIKEGWIVESIQYRGSPLSAFPWVLPCPLNIPETSKVFKVLIPANIQWESKIKDHFSGWIDSSFNLNKPLCVLFVVPSAD